MWSKFWSWITGTSEVPELPPNLFFERDLSGDNDLLISCIFDPSMEVKYYNGVVTRMLDTDKCLIDNQYHYQPRTDKEIRTFPYIEVNSPVRVSLYRKRNSNSEWKIASCCLSKNESRHQVPKPVNSIQFHIDEPTVNVNDSKKNDEEDVMTVQVLGSMPKTVPFEDECTIEILFNNNSYAKEQELIDYNTSKSIKSQLSIKNKHKLPFIIGLQSQYTFNVNLTGKYLGRSTEKVEFIFKDTTYKVGININVTDSRIILPNNLVSYSPKELDLLKLFELQTDNLIRGVSSTKVQFPSVKLGLWNIPKQLSQCFYSQNTGLKINDFNEIRKSIENLYPAAFETLTYNNYKAKFHTLLFIDEIQNAINLQKYAQERIHFEHVGEYLSLKIPNLSEQRPSLIAGDRVAVTDPANCFKRLGDSGRYEGIIHKVLANEILLKFDPEFHSICGHYDYSVSFFSPRSMTRKQHEVVNELWKRNRLGEAFLFPLEETLNYQPPKLLIADIDKEINYSDNLNKETTTLVARPKLIKKIRWFNNKLNLEQKNAVINILKAEGRPMPYVIYGPPGTGKTVTLTESIIQVYKEFPKSKLLICAPTNSAVDILLDKLVKSGLFDKTVLKRLLGYNHYTSVSYNLEHDEYCVLPEFESSFGVPEEISSKMINKRDILKLRIVISTEGTAGLLYMMGLKSGTFSHVFIDEAGQTTEPEILIPLSLVDPSRDGQVILAGDPKQLGPVVLSRLAKDLGQSMLARFISYSLYQRNCNIFPEYNGYNPKLLTHLIQNYRSLPEIVDNFSSLFYSSLLEATKINADVRERIFLNNLNENVHWDIGCKGPIIVHGIEGEDSQEPSSPSWFNPHEAFQVLMYITRLIKAGITADDIGVITPYNAQVFKINELLKMYHPDMKMPKVGTVEMFQGQERMVIIISLVRSKSNAAREKDRQFNLGFLVAKERTNVALSRAKALNIIVGDPSTMLLNHQWKRVLTRVISSNNYVGCNVPDEDKTVS